MTFFGKPISPCATEYQSRSTGRRYLVEAIKGGELTITGMDNALLIFTASRSRDHAMSLIEIADRSPISIGIQNTG